MIPSNYPIIEAINLEKDSISTGEARKMLNYTAWTIHNLIRAGLIKAEQA